MASEESAKSVGWTDCGDDGTGKQHLVNLFALRHIAIEPERKRELKYPADPAVEIVTLYYVGVSEPIRLNKGTLKTVSAGRGSAQAPQRCYRNAEFGSEASPRMSHATIATEHRDIRCIPREEYVATITVPICGRCGHGICPGCCDWCDTLLGTELTLCCDGQCQPSAVTTTIRVASGNRELLQGWIDTAGKLLANTQGATGRPT